MNEYGFEDARLELYNPSRGGGDLHVVGDISVSTTASGPLTPHSFLSTMTDAVSLFHSFTRYTFVVRFSQISAARFSLSNAFLSGSDLTTKSSSIS